jgi:hypothetical protein
MVEDCLALSIKELFDEGLIERFSSRWLMALHGLEYFSIRMDRLSTKRIFGTRRKLGFD